MRIVRQAAEEAGRDWASFEVAQIVNTSVEDDHAAALDAVRWEVASKFLPGKFRSQAAPRLRGRAVDRSGRAAALRGGLRGGRPEGLARAIPPSWIEGLTASGTPEAVRRRVERYREAA